MADTLNVFGVQLPTKPSFPYTDKPKHPMADTLNVFGVKLPTKPSFPSTDTPKHPTIKDPDDIPSYLIPKINKLHDYAQKTGQQNEFIQNISKIVNALIEQDPQKYAQYTVEQEKYAVEDIKKSQQELSKKTPMSKPREIVKDSKAKLAAQLGIKVAESFVNTALGIPFEVAQKVTGKVPFTHGQIAPDKPLTPTQAIFGEQDLQVSPQMNPFLEKGAEFLGGLGGFGIMNPSLKLLEKGIGAVPVVSEMMPLTKKLLSSELGGLGYGGAQYAAESEKGKFSTTDMLENAALSAGQFGAFHLAGEGYKSLRVGLIKGIPETTKDIFLKTGEKVTATPYLKPENYFDIPENYGKAELRHAELSTNLNKLNLYMDKIVKNLNTDLESASTKKIAKMNELEYGRNFALNNIKNIETEVSKNPSDLSTYYQDSYESNKKHVAKLDEKIASLESLNSQVPNYYSRVINLRILQGIIRNTESEMAALQPARIIEISKDPKTGTIGDTTRNVINSMQNPTRLDMAKTVGVSPAQILSIVNGKPNEAGQAIVNGMRDVHNKTKMAITEHKIAVETIQKKYNFTPDDYNVVRRYQWEGEKLMEHFKDENTVFRILDSKMPLTKNQIKLKDVIVQELEKTRVGSNAANVKPIINGVKMDDIPRNPFYWPAVFKQEAFRNEEFLAKKINELKASGHTDEEIKTILDEHKNEYSIVRNPNLERARFKNPLEYEEWLEAAGIDIQKYFPRAERRIQNAAVFGAENENIKKHIENYGATGGDKEWASNYYDIYSGKKRREFSPFVDTINGIILTLKTPFTGIKHSPQGFFNTAALTNIKSSIKGMNQLLTPQGRSVAIQLAKEAGAFNQSGLWMKPDYGFFNQMADLFSREGRERLNFVLENTKNDMMDILGTGSVKNPDVWWHHVLNYTWFLPRMMRNNYIINAAITHNWLKDASDYLIEHPQENSLRTQKIRRQFKDDFKIDPAEIMSKGLTDEMIRYGITQSGSEAMLEGAWRIPQKWQGTAEGRFLTLFKGFHYKQTSFTVEHVFRELKKKNPEPLIAILTAGAAYGAAENRVMRWLNNIKEGEYEPLFFNPALTEYVEGIASIGSIAAFTEIANMVSRQRFTEAAGRYVAGPGLGIGFEHGLGLINSVKNEFSTTKEGQPRNLSPTLGQVLLKDIPGIGRLLQRYIAPTKRQIEIDKKQSQAPLHVGGSNG